MKSINIQFIISMMALCLLVGCALNQPNVGYNDDSALKALIKVVDNESTNLITIDQLQSVSNRDNYINHRIELCDQEYENFKFNLTGVKNYKDFSKEVAVGTMGTVGALVGGGTAQILSAASAATTTADGAVNSVYFYNATMSAIIAAMEAGRLSVLAMIRANQAKLSGNNLTPIYSDYTIWAAQKDLRAYYDAGTISGASKLIQTNSAQQAAFSKQLAETAKDAASATQKVNKSPTAPNLTPAEKNALMLRNQPQ